MPQFSILILFSIPLGILLFFLPTWHSLSNLWLKMDYAYSYGFLCIVIALVTAYKNRENTFKLQTKPSYLAMILLIAASFTWFIAHYLQIQVGAQLTLVAIIFFSVASLYGRRVALSQIVPILYLLLSIPVWDYLNPLLQELTTLVATTMLEATNLAVFIEGNRITLPYGVIEIAGGCSGLRYFLVSLVLTLFYSQQRRNTLKTTTLFFVIAIIFGLIANWVRVTSLILIGYQSKMQSELMADHETFGWIIYIIVAIPAVIIMNYIERHSNEKPAIINSTTYSFTPSITVLVFSLLFLSVGPLLLLLTEHQQIKSSPPYLLNATPPNSLWATQSKFDKSWTPNFKGAKLVDTQSFTLISNQQTVTVVGLFYGKEQQGQELVSDENTLADSKLWNLSSPTNEFHYPEKTPVISTVIRNTRGESKLIYAYYKIGKYQTNKPLLAKLAQLQSLTTPEILKGLFAYRIDCENQCKHASATLSKFIDDYALNASIENRIE
jgi:exosortase A